MSLATPDSVRRLQRKLYVKAKQEPEYRFYLLYDKVHREDVLAHAYRLSRAARGAAGVDGMSFEDIEADGRAVFTLIACRDARAFQHPPACFKPSAT